MKNYRFLILFVILAFTLPYTYGGCGGGGGGSDSGLAYSGLTTPATLTDANAEDVSGGALGAGLIGDGMMGLSVNQDSGSYHINNMRSVQVPQILSDSLKLIDFASASPGGVYAAVESDSDVIPDGCGGSMSYRVSYDSATGIFSGSFTFTNYGCDGTTISGGARFSGRINLSTSEFIEATFSFDTLSGGDLTLDGYLSIDYTVIPNEMTFNAYGQDPASGKVYWIEDYNITIDESVNPVRIEMSGTFYHPDHGYVTLATNATFEIFDGDEWPNSGILVVTGANSFKVKITAIDNTSCSVAGDFDGDGIYEWTPPAMNWEDL